MGGKCIEDLVISNGSIILYWKYFQDTLYAHHIIIIIDSKFNPKEMQKLKLGDYLKNVFYGGNYLISHLTNRNSLMT